MAKRETRKRSQTEALQEVPDRLPQEPITREPTEDEIRRRAYERFERRGGVHGGHFDDWIEAEQELKHK